MTQPPPSTSQPASGAPSAPGVGPAAGGEGAGGPAAATSFVGRAVLVSLMTLLSRVTGLARDAVLAAVFGLSAVADAFFVGFLVPNLFRRLFGEGALSAAFIPHYTDLLKRDPELARRFASLCLALLTVLLVAITLLGEAALAGLLAAREWSDASALAIRLTMLMLPYMPLICLVALIGGVLHVHGRFGPPAAAPLVLNIVMIAFAGWAAWGPGSAGADEHAARLIAVGVLLAGVLQLLWQTVVLLRCTSLTASFAGTWPAVRSTLKMLLPMLVGLAVFQINAFMDSLIAVGLSPREGADTFRLPLLGHEVAYPIETGSVAALQWAQRLYQFPLGVFGIAVATAIFPALAAAAANRQVAAASDEPDDFVTILRHGLRLTVFIGLPASAGLLILREPVTRLIYERGAFEAQDALRVAAILAGYATSVWAYSMMHVLTRSFYAMKDSTTPLRIGLGLVGFNLCLNLVLIWPLGAAGLAWSTATSAAIQVLILLLAVRRYVRTPIDTSVLASWGRTLGLTAAMAVVLLVALNTLDTAALTQAPLLLAVAGLVALGIAIILGGAWLTGSEELRWLINRRATD